MRLLLDDQFAPITSEIGFIEADVDTTAAAFEQWQAPLARGRGLQLVRSTVAGSLPTALSSLLPLTVEETCRYLFVGCAKGWTAYFDSGFQGTDAFSVISSLSEMVGCRGVRMSAVPDSIDQVANGRYGATILEIYGPDTTDFLNTVRSIGAANDGGRWTFYASGEVQPFEDVGLYEARRLRDRFTPSTLDRYLRAMNIEAFEEGFYLPVGSPAVNFEKSGTFGTAVREMSLDEARAHP